MGDDVLSSRESWRTYRTMMADERILFVPEPNGIEAEWQKLTSSDRSQAKLWTDAYLAAFADVAGMQLITLDRAMVPLTKKALLLR
jgi:uncharacterized protein